MNDLTTYELVRDNIKPGDMVSFSGNGVLSWLIKRWSNRSHIACIGSSPTIHHERVLIIEADEGEVNVRALSAKLLKYSGIAYWHPLKPELDLYRDAIDAFLWRTIGVHYDYDSLFKNIVCRVSSDGEKFFCSELSGECIKQIKLEALEKFLPDKYLQKLLDGVALRPGDVAGLPIFLPEVRLI